MFNFVLVVFKQEYFIEFLQRQKPEKSLEFDQKPVIPEEFTESMQTEAGSQDRCKVIQQGGLQQLSEGTTILAHFNPSSPGEMDELLTDPVHGLSKQEHGSIVTQIYPQITPLPHLTGCYLAVTSLQSFSFLSVQRKYDNHLTGWL